MHKLPRVIEEIIELIGEQAALKWVKDCGGMVTYLPRDASNPPESMTPLQWRRLCLTFGGSYLFLPKCHRALLQRRNAVIRQKRQAGASIAGLVRAFNLTDRQIITICGAVEAYEPLHMPLFDEDE